MRILVTLLCAVSLPALAQLKDAAVAVQESEAVVTVTKVDKEARTVQFRGPRGNLGTLNVPKESQNFDQVKVGQQYKMKYVEAVAVDIRKGGAPAAAAAQDVTLNPKGAKPGGMVVRTVQLAGVIDAIDYTERYMAVRGPKGNVVPLKVSSDINMEPLAAGDRITVTHTSALAIEMVEQAKKPAAKKEAAPKK